MFDFNTWRANDLELKLVVDNACYFVTCNQFQIVLTNFIDVVTLQFDDFVSILVSADFDETRQFCTFIHWLEVKI